jgi:hypothetical protein
MIRGLLPPEGEHLNPLRTGLHAVNRLGRDAGRLHLGM